MLFSESIVNVAIAIFSLPLIAVVTIHRSGSEKLQGKPTRGYALRELSKLAGGFPFFIWHDKMSNSRLRKARIRRAGVLFNTR